MQIKDIIQKNEAYKGNNLNIPKELKANAFIAPGVCIACAGHSIDHEQRAKGISTSKPVTIEKDVWTMWWLLVILAEYFAKCVRKIEFRWMSWHFKVSEI